MHKILIADEDATLRSHLASQLIRNEGFDVLEVETANDTLKAVREGGADLLLLNDTLKDMDGQEAVKLLRRENFRGPIIIVADKREESGEIRALDNGANDYLAKPVSVPVLLARIKAALRRHQQSGNASFRVGKYVFDPTQRRLEAKDGSRIGLTEKESRILAYLCKRPRRPVQRDLLLSEVWGYNSAVTTHTLETHMYRLRRKLEEVPTRPRHLVTMSEGYSFVP